MANTLNLGNGNWGVKKDSLLAYNSENGNFKPLPFDFTRASSATVVNKAGLIETVGSGEPRIDFSSDTKGALKLEPQRNNLVLTSASGVYGSSPASETNTISPDGTLNAVIPTPDTTSNRYQYDVSSGTYATNTKLAYSWYRKRISTPVITSFVGDLDIKTLVNLTISEVTTQIESGINGFDRFQVVVQITDGSLFTTFRAYFGAIVGVGNSSVAYFGHQLEVGSYATSYIPTQGSIGTRVQDVCNNGGNEQVINSTEGVLYAEVKALNADVGINRKIVLGDGSYNNGVEFGYQNTTNKMQFIIRSGGVISMNIETTIFDVTEFNKIAISYKSNEGKVFVNGSQIGITDTSVVTPIGLSKLDFKFSTAFNFEGNVKNVKIYNTRLSNAELKALTSN